jgi:hypothetical protein
MMVASNICQKKKVELSDIAGRSERKPGKRQCKGYLLLSRKAEQHGFGDALGARSETAEERTVLVLKLEHALPNRASTLTLRV